jgi:predicted RNase H-like HicB family nuclease
MADNREYRVKLWQDEDGVFIAECLDLDGCHAHGMTRDEAVDQIREAIVAYLDAFSEVDAPHAIENVRIAV